MDEKIFDDKSCVYLAADIAKMLKISRASSYSFLNEVYKNQTPFRVVKINSSIRVPKEEFDRWLRTVG